MTNSIKGNHHWPILSPGWAARIVRRFCQPPPPPAGRCPGGPKKSPGLGPCPIPNRPPPFPPPGGRCPTLGRLIPPIFRPPFYPGPEVKYLPGKDNPNGNNVVDTDHLQTGENQIEAVSKILRWNYPNKVEIPGDVSPQERLQDLKEKCTRAHGSECTVDPETQGYADEQQTIWEEEKSDREGEGSP